MVGWSRGDSLFYKCGMTDPDYCVLRFTTQSGRYYCDLKTKNFAVCLEHTLIGCIDFHRDGAAFSDHNAEDISALKIKHIFKLLVQRDTQDERESGGGAVAPAHALLVLAFSLSCGRRRATPLKVNIPVKEY